MGDLKTKTIKGIYWSGLERFSTLFIQLICTLVIARFLTPSDFGIIGMLSVFIALGTVIIDSGYSQALVRKQNANRDDFTSIFYFNIFLGISLYILLFLFAPFISKFYNTPALTSIARISFLAIPINSLSLIQLTILQKDLNFKVLSKVSIVSSIISGAIGISLAYYMRNAWALIYQALLFSILRVIFLWVLTKWKPNGKVSITPIKEMGRFSVNLLVSGVIGVIFDNLYTILIGKYYRSSDVGLYTHSKRMADIPATSITIVIQQVTYSSLSLIQNDIEKLRENYRKVIRLAVYIITPLMTILIISATPMFDIVLGPQWLGAVVYFKFLCLIGILYPISSINLNILKVVGKSNILLRLEIAKKILLCIILCHTISIDLMAVLYGNLFYALISVFLNLYFCGREIQLSITRQLVDIIPIYMIAAILFVLISYMTIHISITSPSFNLVINTLSFIMLWLGLSYSLNMKAFKELIAIIK